MNNLILNTANFLLLYNFHFSFILFYFILFYFIFFSDLITFFDNFQFSSNVVSFPGFVLHGTVFVYIFLNQFPSSNILKGTSWVKLTGKSSSATLPT